MPVENTSSVAISCDNPGCSHDHGLDPANRIGWLFVSSEVYGSPTQSHVYCCPDCAAMDADEAFVPKDAPPSEVVPMAPPAVVPPVPASPDATS